MNEAKIRATIEDSIATKQRLLAQCTPSLEKLCDLAVATLRGGGKILLCGNGGSSCDAAHAAGELVGWFEQKKRRPYAAIALGHQIPTLTAVGNDAGFEHVFAREVEAGMQRGRGLPDHPLAISGVVGTAIVRRPDGRAEMALLVERPGIPGLPRMLDGVPVGERVTGRLMAFSDPTERQRPVPLGYSVGHPAITAGTIGARVRDALGRVYILSNNHVLANSNGASIGDPAYQPGPFDGGTSAD